MVNKHSYRRDDDLTDRSLTLLAIIYYLLFASFPLYYLLFFIYYLNRRQKWQL